MPKSPEELLAEAIALVPMPDVLRNKILELAPCRLSEKELDDIVDYLGNLHQGIMASMELALIKLLEIRGIRQTVIHEKLAALTPGG